MTWTPDRIDLLTRLWSSGMPTAQIGKELGITKNAVVGKAHRMKLKARPSPIKRGASPQVRRIAVASIPKPAVQAPAIARPAPHRMAAPTPAPRPARAVARANGKGPNCLWPIGDPGDQACDSCGRPAVPAKPYCDEHCARAYIVRNRSESEAA